MINSEKIEGFRLSPQQKHLWLLAQENPISYYRTQGSFLLKGVLDKECLLKSLALTIERLEILRTAFYNLPEMTIPLQVIKAPYFPVVEQYNCQKDSKEKQLNKLEAIFNERLQRPLDIEKLPFLEVALIELSVNEIILVISLPSLCADRSSLSYLMAEIVSCYDQQESEVTRDEPFQYIDFSEWQNELLESTETLAGREYWQEENTRENISLELPLSRQNYRELVSDFEPKFVSVTLEQQQLESLKDLAQKYQVSEQDWLLSCFLILLSRMTSQEEISLGLACDNRHYEDLSQSIGLMTKYLPLSVTLDYSLSFVNFCQQIAQKNKDFSQWQDYFIPQVGELVKQGITFEVDLNANKNIHLTDLDWSLIQQFSCLQPYQLNVCCLRYAQNIEIEFHYNSNSFSLEVIENWLQNYCTLLMNVSANPRQKIEALDILTDQQKERILLQFNPSLVTQKSENYLNTSCIHHLFEKQAKINPQEIALVFEDESLTYDQLNLLSNRLAHHLHNLGLQPDERVGLCLERSHWMVISLLGVLKAGGAYVPLDPTLPPERIKFMIENSQARWVVTQPNLTSLLSLNLAQLVILDNERNILDGYSEENLQTEVKPENLAYIIYTSGSTGKPKGVGIEHRQLFNYLEGIKERLNLPLGASYGLISTFGADLGNTVIFPSLCGGGCLHIISQEKMTDPIALANYYQKKGEIDCLKIVPSHLSALLNESPNPSQLLPKKCLVLGGETTTWRLIETIQSLAPHCRTINHYGPTETTVGVLTYEITQSTIERVTKSVPLGIPLPNTQIFLLDSQLRPVPIGFPGEIYIGGENLARGYLNQSSSSDDSFNQHFSLKVQNSYLKLKITKGQWFNQEAKFKITTTHNRRYSSKNQKIKLSERLYRTGDLARYLPDGNIEFLGRVDHQVKLHGFRIELGEVESQLMNYPAITSVKVLVLEFTKGEKQLVAYLVPDGKNRPKVAELRQFLEKSLPKFMIPSRFVFLERLPLTQNGKLDSKKLPLLETGREQIESDYVAPNTENEKILAKIWSEVLHIDRVGLNDNFFELGGDSILSIQIAARAKVLGLNLKPIDLFQYQTFAELVKILKNQEIKLELGDNKGEVPLTPIQEWFFQQSLSNPHHWNMSILLDIPWDLSRTETETLVNALIAHHDSLRLRFSPTENGWIQRYTEVKDITPCLEIDLAKVTDAALSSILGIEATKIQKSLSLDNPLLLRVVRFNLGKKWGVRLLFVVHHLLMDGISWRIWLEDLDTAYNQLQKGEKIDLGNKTTSFQYWAQKLRNYAQSESILSELDYWLAQFPSSPVYLPRIEQQVTKYERRMEKVKVFLEKETTEAILSQVSRLNHTQINELVLCGLLRTYQSWTGKNELWIELEGHGRETLFEEVDISRTIGWFTTRFPLLFSCDPSLSPLEMLQVVKGTLRQIPHGGIGYGILRYLNQQRKIKEKFNHLPQPELCFNYLGKFTQKNTIFSLSWENRGIEKSGLGENTPSISLDTMVIDGQIYLEWTYNPELYQRETIEKLAIDTVNEIKNLITDFLDGRHHYHPSDFPLASLTKSQLDYISKQFSEIADIYPLSSLQQGLLFHCLYEKASNLYFQQKVFTLEGEINQNYFRRAWEKVVNRHDSLKTAFIWQDLPTPLQVVLPEITLPWTSENWENLSPRQQDAALDNYLRIDLERGFSFSDAPLMRIALIKLSTSKYYLIWSHHHLLLDGWCNGIIFQEIFTIYQALSQGIEEELPPAPHYKDYINWLGHKNDSAAEQFWKKALKGIKGSTRWGIESTGINSATTRGKEQSIFSEEITNQLNNWAKLNHLTLNTIIQGCFALLLSRYSGEDEVIFGATVSGRSPEISGVESLVGLLINTIPVKVLIISDQNFLGWLKQLQQQQIEYLEHQYSPLVQIQQWSNLNNGNQLFESFITVENYPINSELRGEKIKIVDVQSFSRTNYSFNLTVEFDPDLSMVIDYDCQKLTATDIYRVLTQLQNLIENVTNYAEQTLSEIIITTTNPEETEQLLNSFNADFD